MARILGEESTEILISDFDKVPSILSAKPSKIVDGEGTVNWDYSRLILTIPPRCGLILA